MNREETHAYLTAERPLKAEAVSDPQGLAERYPFCSVLHTMAAEYAHATGESGYEERLRVAAVYAYNRELLYDLLMRPSLERTVRAFDEAVEAESSASVSAETQNESIELSTAPTAEDGTSDDVATELASPSDQAVVEVPEAPSIHPEENHENVAALEDEGVDCSDFVESPESPEPEVPVAPVKRASEYDALHRETLLEAINSSIELEVMGDEDEAQDAPLAEAVDEQDETVAECPKPKVEGKSAYARWLMQHRRQSMASESNEANSLPDDPKGKQSALIDRFIAADPKITPGKAELFSTENLAKMSLVEDEGFVTETMAMIYARQGHVKKAIRAYTLLGLKYPEKSVYFANQIKRLQQRPK